MWPGKIVVKGIKRWRMPTRSMPLMGLCCRITEDDSDRAPVPFHLLPEVAREVGDHTSILVDTGVMNGADVVAAHAVGADFVLVGRAWLYGLMAGGRAGVDRMIAILESEIRRTMGLLGVSNVAELNPKHVTQLMRLAPRDVLGRVSDSQV